LDETTSVRSSFCGLKHNVGKAGITKLRSDGRKCIAGRLSGFRMLNVAINGLGRIGRATLKIVADKPGLRLTAVNDVLAADDLAYLLKFDTVYGRWRRDVIAHEKGLNTPSRVS
jgi:hypothetical protein